ncbi:hypothetical protein B296_00024985 [Ensete ventricosum]|uniref:Uncharacterized protein n=1 Tax=Ensete ventricosum TaxID=4639 RepID=A0A426YBM6_ENSVE|nr:hypothetical protein B296_00024985 [Ensete ventricosum]
MDLNVLRKKPRMPRGKGAPAAGPEGAQPKVEVIHAVASAKRPIGNRVCDSGRLVTHMGNQTSLLEAVLEKLKSERDSEQLARARQRVDKLEADNAKLRSGLDELSGRLEEAGKELNEL